MVDAGPQAKLAVWDPSCPDQGIDLVLQVLDISGIENPVLYYFPHSPLLSVFKEIVLINSTSRIAAPGYIIQRFIKLIVANPSRISSPAFDPPCCADDQRGMRGRSAGSQPRFLQRRELPFPRGKSMQKGVLQ
jgi:hypothetical protein